MTLLLQAAQENPRPPKRTRAETWIDQVLAVKYRRYCRGEPWAPGINLYETKELFCVVVDLAGVSANEIDVRVEDGVLAISGRRSMPMAADLGGQVRVHLMEIDHGHFCRRIELPAEADVSDVAAVQATYRSGLLWVRIPRKG